MAPPRAQTPEALADFLAKHGILGGEPAEASRRLAESVTAERYGAADVEPPSNPLKSLETARRALWAAAPPSARFRAVFAPRSLLRRGGAQRW
ncbi:MAG: hypothetical protein L0G23_01885 [Ruaniaceae bacterium]|nr:hypothetical protein [Ruaniaceae bacterium]